MKLTLTDDDGKVLESHEASLFIFGAVNILDAQDNSIACNSTVRFAWDETNIREPAVGLQIAFLSCVEALKSLHENIHDEAPQKAIFENAMSLLEQITGVKSHQTKGTTNVH